MISIFGKDNQALVKLYVLFCMVFLATAAPIFTPSALAAGDNSMITNVLCNATNQLTGGIGKSIAILIVISLAIALFLGKVTWGIAIAVAVGMGLLFGARDAVNLLSGSNTPMCT